MRLLFSILLLSLGFHSSAIALHIVLDPGHGGHDMGATRGNIRESEIALQICRHLAQVLREKYGHQVSLTRERDEFLSLSRRAEIALKFRPDIFLSIHANSSQDPRAHGIEIYFQNQLPPDEETLFLASKENQEMVGSVREEGQGDLPSIVEDLQKNYRMHSSMLFSDSLYSSLTKGKRKLSSHIIRQAPFFVVSQMPNPSVLLEVGFLSHRNEGPMLAQTAYQKDLAQQIAAGIQEFKEILDKDKSVALNK